MGILDVIFNRTRQDDTLEIEHQEEPKETISVRVENLGGMIDVDRMLKMVKEGNILLIKTKELQRKDLGEFQTSVQKLKRNLAQFGGDIVGTEDGYLIVTPKFAKIER